MDFSETIVVCDLKLATEDLPRGYIHVLNYEKIVYSPGAIYMY